MVKTGPRRTKAWPNDVTVYDKSEHNTDLK